MARREVLIHEQETERRLILGLKFESQEQCLTQHIENAEVEGQAVAAFGPSTSSAGNQLEVNTMPTWRGQPTNKGPNPVNLSPKPVIFDPTCKFKSSTCKFRARIS